MEQVKDILRKLYSHVEEGLNYSSETIPGGNLGLVALCAVTYVSLKIVYTKYRMSVTKQLIADRGTKAEANKLRLQKRLENCKVDLSITDLSFNTLREKLQSGELRPTQVLLAYQAKALQVTRELNCVTEFIENAEERAEALEKLPPNQRGPLYGIPFSVKEVVGIKNTDCTMGMSVLIGVMIHEDGVLVKVLVDQGAIPFARTNLSQGQMSIGCYNPIFGLTLNPVNKHFTSGGSSGGEGALIGAGASLMGFGCDMGGSVRAPAAFCGCCGMKPTPHRSTGLGNIKFGQYIGTLSEVYGPLGRDVNTCMELYKSMLVPQVFDLDPLLPPLPWREEIYCNTKPLKIGFYLNLDGAIESTPAVKRCILEAKQALEKRGHTVVEFQVPGVAEAYELFNKVMLGDGLEGSDPFLKYEVLDLPVKEMNDMLSMPLWLRVILSRILPGLSPLDRDALSTEMPMTVGNWWVLNEQVDDYKRNKFLAAWKAKGLDGVICPVLPFAAFPKDMTVGAEAGLPYTTLYNVVGFPCGSVPFGKVEKRDLDQLKQEYPKTYSCHKYVHKISENSEGLPIGVQCVALPFQEEVCFRLMKEIEESLKTN